MNPLAESSIFAPSRATRLFEATQSPEVIEHRLAASRAGDALREAARRRHARNRATWSRIVVAFAVLLPIAMAFVLARS